MYLFYVYLFYTYLYLIVFRLKIQNNIANLGWIVQVKIYFKYNVKPFIFKKKFAFNPKRTY